MYHVCFFDLTFGKFTVGRVPFIPRIGDSLGLFNSNPLPIVTTVIVFPSPELVKEHCGDLLKNSKFANEKFDAIVFGK
jgi:hypothetical protein